MNSRFGSSESDVDIVALAKDGVGTAHQRLSCIRKMLRNRFRDDDIQSNSNSIQELSIPAHMFKRISNRIN